MKNYVFYAAFLSASCYASAYDEDCFYRTFGQYFKNYEENIEKNDLEKSIDNINKTKIQEDKDVIADYFSKTYYSNAYQIPEELALDHYIQEGAQKGFFPHPAFDPHWYLTCFPQSESPFTDWLTKDYWIKFREEKNLTIEDLDQISEPQYLWSEKGFKPKGKIFKPYRFKRNNQTKLIVHFFSQSLKENIDSECDEMMLLSKMIAADPLKPFYMKEKELIKEHRLWVTSLSQPSEPPREKLETWVQGLKKANLESHFWCLRASDIPHTISFLKEYNIKIHEIQELFPMQGYNLEYALYRNNQFTLCSDLIRFEIIAQHGGIYSDLGYEYFVDPSYLCRLYDYLFYHNFPEFFDRAFFFAPKKDPLIDLYLSYVKDTSWLVNYVEKNKLEKSYEQWFLIGCANLNVNFLLNRQKKSIFLLRDDVILKIHRLRSWLGRALFGNNSLDNAKIPSVYELAHYTYQPHMDNPYLVMTTGTFDLFHEGHLEILKRAKQVGKNEAFGDVAFLGQKIPSKTELHVGIRSDNYILSHKKHPTYDSERVRLKMVEEQKSVDYAFLERDEKHKLDFLQKADWAVWGDDVKARINYRHTFKTALSFLPRTPGISTTERKNLIPEHVHKNTYVSILNDQEEEIYKIPEGKENSIKQTYQLARDVEHILNQAHIKFFFTAGTLLGIVRYGGMHQWDDDLDAYLVEPSADQLQSIKQVLEEKGYRVKDDIGVKQNYKCLGYQVYASDQAYCDLFVAKKRENGMYHICSHWKDFEFSDEEIFPVKKGKFGSQYLTIPNMYLRILYKNYGSNCITHIKKYNHSGGGKKNTATLALMEKGEELPAGPF